MSDMYKERVSIRHIHNKDQKNDIRKRTTVQGDTGKTDNAMLGFLNHCRLICYER